LCRVWIYFAYYCGLVAAVSPPFFPPVFDGVLMCVDIRLGSTLVIRREIKGVQYSALRLV
jgi:hypothetical protein